MFRARSPPQGAWKNLVCALKLWATLQAGAKKLVDTTFEGLQEKSRLKIDNDRRKFIEVDNQEVVKVGDLEGCNDVLKEFWSSSRRRWF